MRTARFEIVRVDGGWFVRFWASNNRIAWITPGLYSRRRTALRAIEVFIDHFPGVWLDKEWDPATKSTIDAVVRRYSAWEKTNAIVYPIREVDERAGVES